MDFRTWLPHVEAMRGHLIRCGVAWVVAAVGVFVFKEAVLEVVLRPLHAAVPGINLLTTGVTDVFAAYIKLAVWGGLLLAVPVVLVEVWRFIRPALYPAERRLVGGLLLAVPVLSCVGILFGWWVLLPPMLAFFLGFTAEGVVAMPRLADYISLLVSTLGLLAVAFNFPLLLVGLVRLGVVQVATLAAQRRVVLVGMFAVSAVVTPTPDPLSMTLLAVPLYVLFEIALLVAKRMR
ncbi:MAG: twin-arginine translocase subunit TatC [Alphaproteobacteria bacterium]